MTDIFAGDFNTKTLANARLIAAAPTLLAELIEVQAYLQADLAYCREHGSQITHDFGVIAARLRDVNAAISAATKGAS